MRANRLVPVRWGITHACLRQLADGDRVGVVGLEAAYRENRWSGLERYRGAGDPTPPSWPFPWEGEGKFVEAQGVGWVGLRERKRYQNHTAQNPSAIEQLYTVPSYVDTRGNR